MRIPDGELAHTVTHAVAWALSMLGAAFLMSRAWETGDPKTVSAAMATFRSENQDALLERSPVPKADQVNYREWSKKFAKWLYGTEHIAIHYSIDYDGVDIRKLSPGSRGIRKTVAPSPLSTVPRTLPSPFL